MIEKEQDNAMVVDEQANVEKEQPIIDSEVNKKQEDVQQPV